MFSTRKQFPANLRGGYDVSRLSQEAARVCRESLLRYTQSAFTNFCHWLGFAGNRC
jgi:hypothetical protein